MVGDNKFFEDLSKVVGSAMNTAVNSAVDIKAHFDEMIKEQLDKALDKANLVTRQEFEVVREMAAKAREENKKLEGRIAELEKK